MLCWLNLGGDEPMKKVKLIIAAVAMLGFVSTASTTALAAGLAPGEGVYAGIFVGHSAGHVDAKTAVEHGSHSDPTTTTGGVTTTFEVKMNDGGVGLEGVEGGGYLGCGYKIGDAYIGFESDYAGGGAKFNISSGRAAEFTISDQDTTETTYDKIDVETKWTAGGGGRIGYYLSPSTLLSIKGGIAASKFDVVVGSASESFYGGGPRLGMAIESALTAIDPNLSVRLSWDYTDYLTAPVNGIGSFEDGKDKVATTEVSGAMYNARFGIQYSFFVVNSLF